MIAKPLEAFPGGAHHEARGVGVNAEQVNLPAVDTGWSGAAHDSPDAEEHRHCCCRLRLLIVHTILLLYPTRFIVS